MNSTPIFINKDTTILIHQQQILRFGGSSGLRDEALLESALGAAEQCWSYTNDIYQTAAQYCFSLAKNHAFVDGNKRIAAAIMLSFLRINGIKLIQTPDQLYAWIIAIATSELKREDLARLLAEHSQPF